MNEPLDIRTVEGDVVFLVKDPVEDKYGRHRCPCGNPGRIISLSFEASYCTFGCLTRQWDEFNKLV